LTEDFRKIARRRIKEARILYAASEYSGAYYLAGYAIECALKACILNAMRKYHMPDKKIVVESHTHDLTQLVILAGLKADRDQAENADPAFGRNWAVVKDWNEGSRYESWTRQDAEDLIRAVNQRTSGVHGPRPGRARDRRTPSPRGTGPWCPLGAGAVS
jgi:HEPN domain-containing protein